MRVHTLLALSECVRLVGPCGQWPWYCSEQCQNWHWRLDHQRACGSRVARRELLDVEPSLPPVVVERILAYVARCTSSA